jgi:hypothetical protein
MSGEMAELMKHLNAFWTELGWSDVFTGGKVNKPEQAKIDKKNPFDVYTCTPDVSGEAKCSLYTSCYRYCWIN